MQELNFSLNKLFDNDDGYEAYKMELEEVYLSLKNQYAFVALKEETWRNLFIQAMNKVQDKLDKTEIFLIVKARVRKYISEQITNNKTRIVNNMLIIMVKENSSYKVALKRFLRSLELHDMEISDDYFEILKKESPLLKKMMRNLGIYNMSLKEMKHFLNKQEDIYSRLKASNLSYDENKKLVDCLFSYLNVDALEIKNYMLGNIDDRYRKVKYYLSYYGMILEIYKLYKEKIRIVNKEFFDRAILSFSLEEFKSVIEGYKRYTYDNSDTNFLIKLNSRVLRNLGSIIGKEAQKPKKVEEDLKSKDKKTRKRKYNNILEYLPDKKGITVEEKKEIVNKILGTIDGYTNNLLIEYFRGNIKSSDSRYSNVGVALRSIKTKYEKECDSLLKSKNSKKTIYDYFPLREGITEKIRKEIVDKVFAKITIRERNLVRDYIDNGNESVSLAFQDIIVYMQNEYKREIDKILNPKKEIKLNEKIYEYFPLREGITEKIRKEIVDKLFANITLEQFNLVNDYIDGKIETKDKRYSKAYYILASRRKKYNEYDIKLLALNLEYNHRKFKTIYEFFPLKEGITEEIRKQIVDKLFKELDVETKCIVNDYVAGKFGTKDARYRIANNTISNMQYKYKRYGKRILKEGLDNIHRRKYSTMYEYFPIREGIEEDERKKIVDVLFKNLDNTSKTIVNDYIAGKFSYKDKEKYKFFKRIMSKMFYDYNLYGKEILKPGFKRKSRWEKLAIYEHFPLQDGMTIEERKKIVDKLFKELDNKVQTLINDYIAGKFGTKDERYKIVKSAFTSMKKKYKKFGRKLLDSNFEMKRKGDILTIYERFPIQEGMTEEERNKIVDILFKELDGGIQELINDYVAGKFGGKDERYKIVKSAFLSMKRKYRKKGKKLLNISFDRKVFEIIPNNFPLQVSMSSKKINENIARYEKDIFFRDIIELINREFKIKLDDVVDVKRYLLYTYAKVIEYIYREKFGMLKSDYLNYFNRRILELFSENSSCSLEDLIVLYVNSEYEVIKNKEIERK